MDANENSLGPPLRTDGNQAQQELERYPCPHQLELKELYAKWRGIRREEVFLGVGSDEAIDLLVRMACVPSKDSILILPPTYGMYSVCAQINDANVVEVPLDDGFVLNPEKVVKTIQKQPSASPIKIVFVCHPNNPTGNDVASEKDLERLAGSIGNALLVIDEAYVDFSVDRPSMSCLIERCPNVVVLQTFSKSWGLAGIRCGVAMANEKIVDFLTKMKAPYNLNKMTSQIATKAMSHLDDLMSNVKLIVGERERVSEALTKTSGIDRVFASHSNFVLFRTKEYDAKKLHVEMANAGVVIRYRGSATNCESCLRVSIGSKDENDKFLSTLRSILSNSS